MAKTRKLLQENLGLVDVVIELSDARIPLSSRNPDLAMLVGNRKPLIRAYNKTDLADPQVTGQWQKSLAGTDIYNVFISSATGAGLTELMYIANEQIKMKLVRDKVRGLLTSKLRIMIAGIPNSGKSTLINKLSGRRAAAAADKPGVTRGKQWIRINESIELLDTPGVLWPKFDNPEVALNLAFTGTIGENAVDPEELAALLLAKINSDYKSSIERRYKVVLKEILAEFPEHQLHNNVGSQRYLNGNNELLLKEGTIILDGIGRKRGFLSEGGRIDTLRTSIMILDEFRGGRIGRISLERPS